MHLEREKTKQKIAPPPAVADTNIKFKYIWFSRILSFYDSRPENGHDGPIQGP